MKIQSNQQTFGTRVLMGPSSKEIIVKSPAKKEIFSQIENIKKNGTNDFLILGASLDEMSKKVYINAEIFEFIDNKFYVSAFDNGSPLEKKSENGQKRYLDINVLYQSAKKNMIEYGKVTKDMFDSILHEYQEM